MTLEPGQATPLRVPFRRLILRPWRWNWRAWAVIILLTVPVYLLSYAPMFMLALGVTGHSDGIILQTVIRVYRPAMWLEEHSEIYSDIYHWESRAVAPIYQWMLRRQMESQQQRTNQASRTLSLNFVSAGLTLRPPPCSK